MLFSPLAAVTLLSIFRYAIIAAMRRYYYADAVYDTGYAPLCRYAAC